MTVNAAGVGSSSPIAASALLPLPPTAAASSADHAPPDRATSQLLEFSRPDIHSALHLPENHAAAETLVRQAIDAVAHNDIPHALKAASELLHQQPSSDLRLLHEPALAPIRTELHELIAHRTLEAKVEAIKTLAIAAPLAAAARMPPETPAVLSLANQFIETGQFINYVRAHQLGGLVISWSQMPAPSDHVEQNIARAVRSVASLWRRAPMLVLLIAWLLLGIVLLPFDPQLWATGFLALAVFQFLITLRSWRRRL